MRPPEQFSLKYTIVKTVYGVLQWHLHIKFRHLWGILPRKVSLAHILCDLIGRRPAGPSTRPSPSPSPWPSTPAWAVPRRRRRSAATWRGTC